MTPFRALLILFLLAVGGYTAVTIAGHGWNLLPDFFGAVSAFTWQGQFNLDFLTYLILSGLWTAWRGGFTAASIALGVVAAGLGILFLAAYLLVLDMRHRGDRRAMLLGVHAGR
jgi:hypothetical protein